MASLLRFGTFELDRRNFELRQNGEPVKLDRTPLELLFFFADRRGALVSKEEAVDHVWRKDVFVETDSSFYTAVRKIRKALDDDTGEPRFIQTVSRKGSRFIAQVEEVRVTPTAVAESAAVRGPGDAMAVPGRPVRVAWRTRRWPLRIGVTLASLAIDAFLIRLFATHSPAAKIMLIVHQFDWPAANREFRRAIELEPNNPYAHFFYSNSYLSPFGRHEEAITEMKKAMQLDPLSTAIQSFAGRTLIWARYGDALAQFQRANQLDPNFALNHERLAQLYPLMGNYDKAVDEETSACLLSGEKPQDVVADMTALRRTVAARGAQGDWETELHLLAGGQQPPEAYSRPFGLPIVYAHLGQTDKALANLEIAYRQRDTQITEIAIEPQFDSLRSWNGGSAF